MFHNIIFCIFACDTIERYKQQIAKIEQTWGKSEAIKILFFLGENGPLVGENYIHLENVANDYLSAADKQYLGIKYVHDHFNYRYLYVCGTDAFVLVNNLLNFIEPLPSDNAFIMGGHGDTRIICNQHVHYFAGGPGFILTKKAVQLLYPKLSSMQSEWLDICVANNYLTYIPACDLSICYFLKQLGVPIINVPNRFFNCNYRGYNNTPRGSLKCCTQSIDYGTMIACHNMTPSDFDTLHKLVS